MQPSLDLTIPLADPAATERLGELLGTGLQIGQMLALVGELGAGKTCLARGVARGLAVDEPDEVSSPTYLLVIEHAGPKPMVHIDAYLPAKTRGFLLDGGIDYLEECGGVAVVEWADRIRDLWPPETLEVQLAADEAGGRVARLRGPEVFGWVREALQDGGI